MEDWSQSNGMSGLVSEIVGYISKSKGKGNKGKWGPYGGKSLGGKSMGAKYGGKTDAKGGSKGGGKDGGKSGGPKGGKAVTFHRDCWNCGLVGHSMKNCPSLNRGFPGKCHNCGIVGHSIANCPKKINEVQDQAEGDSKTDGESCDAVNWGGSAYMVEHNKIEPMKIPLPQPPMHSWQGRQ